MLARVLALAAVASAVLAPAAAAADVTAGPLRAEVGTGAWRLAFEDARGRTVLAEAPGLGAGPTGRLGFRTADRWFHATRVISSRRRGGAFEATLATNDPAGRRLEVRVAPDASGVIALTARVTGAGVTHTGVAFAARGAERYLGFGERSNAVDQRGRDVESYVAEGPFEADERGAVPSFVPAWGFHPRDDATYFPMPWLLSTAGYGVLVDSPETSLFRLGTDARAAWSVEVEAPRLSLRVFAGPRPADVLRRMTAGTGRQPPAPGAFVFGPWYQPRDDEQAILAGLRRRDVPLSVAQTYTHYLPCESQAGRRDAERARVGRFHREGLAVTTYFNPMICTTHSRFGRPGTRCSATQPAGPTSSATRRSRTSRSPSSTSAPGRAGLSTARCSARRSPTATTAGWRTSVSTRRSTHAPPAARPARPCTTCTRRQLPLRRLRGGAAAARYVRSGWTGTARCAPIVWGGDPTVDWGFDGLRSVVTNGLTMGLSGVSTWGSDVGGFFALFENRLSASC